MTALETHAVQITITQDSLGVARAGFGVPLILSHNASFAERVRYYTDLAGLVSDSFATDSPEYLSASAMFAQNPKPSRVAIGRAANAVTQQYTIVPDVLNSTAYQYIVRGEGVETTTVSFTSDASATLAEIITGLETAFNAVTGKNYTAVDTGPGTSLVITGNAPGNWFSIEAVKIDLQTSLEQTHADPGVAADLIAISVEQDDWYCLHTLYNSSAYTLAAAAHIETVTKIYVFDDNDISAPTTTAGSATDAMDVLATATRARTAAAYHHSPAEFFSAAWMGRMLPLDPGQGTWKFKTLSGITPTTLTSTHVTNLLAKHGNFYRAVAGKNITIEGTTADGDFIDVQRGIDWIEDDMAKGVFEALSTGDKVPYTDSGVSTIETEMRGTVRTAINMGILALSPEPSFEIPLVASISSVDKAARNLPDMKFGATLAGAIHKVNIKGVVSV